MAASGQGKTVNLAELPLPQLGSLKQQLDQEIELLTNSIQQLSAARNKFQESGECVKKQSSLEDKASVLVPLTGSMYVPGEIINRDKFLIDIGTGYYVEKDTKTSIDFFTRKVNFLNTQIEKYVKIVQEKAYVRENVMEVIQVKQQQMIQAAATKV